MISVLILTYNEEKNISACLNGVSFSDDIFILDSFSNDNTETIASSFGAKVIKREFDNYAAQRNYGLNLEFKNNWILMIDADEIVTADLYNEIKAIAEDLGNKNTLYRVRRKDYFMGKWIKYSSGYPTWFGRFFKKGKVRVEREINEEYYTDGAVGYLKKHLIHYPFNKGLDYWFERHNNYSTMESEKLSKERLNFNELNGLLNTDPMIRRKIFKKLAYRVPFRPVFTFVFLYIFKLGFLDGLAGLHYSLMRSFYEYQIDLKLLEIKKKKI